MMERLIDAEKKGKKEMCATCKAAMEEINKSDDNCPIILEKMIFHVFSHYMSTKKSKIFWGYLFATSYGGVRSSLTHLYRMSGNTMDGDFKNNYINSCWE